MFVSFTAYLACLVASSVKAFEQMQTLFVNKMRCFPTEIRN